MTRSLLDEGTLEKLDAAVTRSVARLDDVMRVALYGKSGDRTPPGYKRLEGPDAELFITHLRRQALQEQEGTMPGNLGTEALANPAMQQVLAEQQRVTEQPSG